MWIFNVTIWGFDLIENKDTLHRGKDCMRKFYEFLQEHVKNIIEFEKKKMLALTKEKLKSQQDAKILLYFWKKNLKKAL